jgi:hypothetical protein
LSPFSERQGAPANDDNYNAGTQNSRRRAEHQIPSRFHRVFPSLHTNYLIELVYISYFKQEKSRKIPETPKNPLLLIRLPANQPKGIRNPSALSFSEG